MSQALRFLDEWTVSAPVAKVFDVMSDLRTYAEWGSLTYLSCEADGPPSVGRIVRVCVKGPLPFRIRFDLTLLEIDPGSRLRLKAAGDIDGEWTMRFEPRDGQVT